MTTRIPGSERTRETLNELINGRMRVDDAKSELVKLATRLIGLNEPKLRKRLTCGTIPEHDCRKRRCSWRIAQRF